MGMKEILEDTRSKLHSGQLSNEAQVKQAVILPILRELGWDDTNPLECIPEYPVDRQHKRGSVDYALTPEDCDHPMVFIEAKRLGNVTEAGEEQVFSYATNQGIPYLILTDGNIWRFYLSMAAGVPPRRKFHEIELQHGQRIDNYAQFLEQFLHKDRVSFHETILAAQRLLSGRQQRAKARAAIPAAWRTLLATPDQSLRDLVTVTVKKEYRSKLSATRIRQHIETACRLMRIQFGTQLKLIER